MTQYKGFDLFDDIEDEALRNRNRAVVMANIVEDNTKALRINAKGAGLLIGYFSAILPEDKKSVRKLFEEFVKQRGYVHEPTASPVV